MKRKYSRTLFNTAEEGYFDKLAEIKKGKYLRDKDAVEIQKDLHNLNPTVKRSIPSIRSKYLRVCRAKKIDPDLKVRRGPKRPLIEQAICHIKKGLELMNLVMENNSGSKDDEIKSLRARLKEQSDELRKLQKIRQAVEKYNQ